MKGSDPGNKLFLVFGCVFSLAGGIVFAQAQANLSLLENSSTTPHTLTAAELAASGPGSNYFVHITNFKLINPRIGSRSEDAKHTKYFLVCDMIPTQASHHGQKHVPQKGHEQPPHFQVHNSLVVSNFFISNMGSADLNSNDRDHFLRRSEMTLHKVTLSPLYRNSHKREAATVYAVMMQCVAPTKSVGACYFI